MRSELVTFVSPKTPISEVFKTLRTNIQFMNVDETLKSILVTSTVPGEGKSWVTSNLAVTFAQTGKRVLIVDADMRKGRQHLIFNVKNEKGLSNYLTMTTKKDAVNNIGEYIQSTMVENLYIMTSGTIPPNPSELLASKKMVDIIRYLEEIFDIIIFDGTPSTMVTDAIILSKFVNTTLIVSAYKETKSDNLNQVKRNILNVGGNIAGVILNKIPYIKKEYGSGYYYENAMMPSKKIRKIKNNNKSKKKKIADSEIKEVKRKLNEVQTSKNDKKAQTEEIDVSAVLQQLSKYIANNNK